MSARAPTEPMSYIGILVKFFDQKEHADAFRDGLLYARRLKVVPRGGGPTEGRQGRRYRPHGRRENVRAGGATRASGCLSRLLDRYDSTIRSWTT